MIYRLAEKRVAGRLPRDPRSDHVFGMSSSGALLPPKKADPPPWALSYVQPAQWAPAWQTASRRGWGLLEGGQAGPAGSWGPGGRPGTQGELLVLDLCWCP